MSSNLPSRTICRKAWRFESSHLDQKRNPLTMTVIGGILLERMVDAFILMNSDRAGASAYALAVIIASKKLIDARLITAQEASTLDKIAGMITE